MKPVLITIMNKHSFEREYYKCLYELGHFYYLIQDDEDLDFAIEQELRYEGPPSLFVVYKKPMIHYLRNLIETMIGNKCDSGILVTDKKPSLINSILNLQIINKYKKIKFIIIE